MPSSAGSTSITALTATAATGNTITQYSLKSVPGGGTLYLNTTAVTAARTFTPEEAGQLKFDPSGTASGNFTFTYTATNNDGLESNTATYTIPVANVPPQVTSDVATTAYNTVASLNVLSNDTDRDGSINASTVDLNPDQDDIQTERVVAGQGTFRVSPQGIVTFTPANNYVGTSIINYTVRDNLGVTSDQATIRVTVVGVTAAYDDSNEVEKGIEAKGNVILNDADPRNTGFDVTLVTDVKNGKLTLNPNGSYTYVPNSPFTGTDSFVYRACDKPTTGTAQCDEATVYLNVYDPAVQCIAATGPNLLVNPSFTDGNVGFNTNYTYKANDPNSTTELNPENTYAVGSDASQYHGNFRGNGLTGAGDNFLMINATSAIRTLYSQTFRVQPNRYYTFSAHFNNLIPTTSNIPDPVVGFVINGASTSSTISVPENPDSWVKFTDVWYSGDNTTATFEIRNLTLDANGNDVGIDELYFGTCNAIPVANPTATTAIASNASRTTIAAMDAADSDGQIASFTIVTLPSSSTGTLFVNGAAATEGQKLTPEQNDQLSFAPTSVNGNTTFTFYATDNTGSVSNTAVYTIPVGNTAPLAQNITSASVSNTAATTAISALQATDSDGQITSYTITSVPNATAGTLYVNGTALTTGVPLTIPATQANTIAYDPSGKMAGNVNFQYYATDNQGNTSNTATYTVQIGNEMPVAQNRTTTPMRNTAGATAITPLAATDSDGTITSFTVTSLPAKAAGVLRLNGVDITTGQTLLPEQVNELTFDPEPSATGTLTFRYTATDNLGGVSAPATYSIPLGGPLPVNLVSFEAAAADGNTRLTWRTAQEIDHDYFEVERSFTGTAFTSVGKVRSRQASTAGSSYQFTDARAAYQGYSTAYYRLKQVDTDGSSVYSRVQTVHFSAMQENVSFAIVPNPATTKAGLDLRALPAGTYHVVVVDATGRTVHSASYAAGEVEPLAVHNWPAGIYTVVARQGKLKYVQRLVKH
ncbi:Ig-like domain-containing protein [Hymenobacter mucosus]|nr:tandem-95 repeat protein [Hymenobacter mucosus]